MFGDGTLKPEEIASGDASPGGLTGLHKLVQSMHRTRDPCQGCPHRERCAEEKLACKDFTHFVNSGRYSDEPEKRQPTRRRYDQVFAVHPHLARRLPEDL
ncbi:hypothetical protein QWY84_05500 [Aquisalimonas lutea]|uniref:hypothetical protein n=1 Tax=Aquisalimonas lutea TaxID=1327750 RepID=UPI0025B4D8BF|nr:hypothetical protein [Aquisalimonas lutea]MDN3517059.1 hypothetical protein [Aquisalimonas lutea]